MFYSFATHVFTLKRQTAILRDSSAVAASMSLERQPGSKGTIQFKVSEGTTGSGVFTVSGVSSGVSITEDVTFTRNTTKCTLASFTSVSGITSTGFTGESSIPNVLITAASKDGQPIAAEYTYAASRPCMLRYLGRAHWRGRHSGTHEQQEAAIMLDFEEAFMPRAGDMAYDDNTPETRWIIGGVKLIGGYARPNHFELTVNREE